MTTQSQSQTQNKTPKEKPYVIVDFLDLDPECITFLSPKQNAHGGHFIPLRYNGKSLYVTYEARTCPFGVSTNKEEKPEYKGKYSDGKKITGFSTSISCHKEYENDPYYKKALELDEFFIDACHQNAMYWHLGGTATRPLGRDAIEGYDDRGADGKWKRLVKWSYKKEGKTNERNYLEYPPRLEFGIPTSSMSEHQGPDGLMIQEAVLKPVFFDQEANKLEAVTSNDVDQILPKWSRLSTLVQWGTITQGTYGATLKPKAQQFRVYPNEQLATDACLLNDDGEQEYDVGDTLASSDFSGGAKITKLNNSNPAPLDLGEPEDDVETVEAIEASEAIEAIETIETIEVVGDDAIEPEPVQTRPTRAAVSRPTRRVVSAKKT